MDATFSRTDRILAQLAKGLLPIVCLVALIAATPLQRSEEQMGIILVNTSSTTATFANDPSTLDPSLTYYNEICIKAEWTSSSQKVWISSFSTVNESIYGWSLVGGEKECHDWNQNVKIYIWHSDGEASKEVRLLPTR